jgi:hypothetical protein
MKDSGNMTHPEPQKQHPMQGKPWIWWALRLGWLRPYRPGINPGLKDNAPRMSHFYSWKMHLVRRAGDKLAGIVSALIGYDICESGLQLVLVEDFLDIRADVMRTVD